MAFSLVFTTACDPLDDINADIDSQESYVVGDANYTVTTKDYSDLKLNFGSFSNVDDAKTMIPGLLSKAYPVWGKGSSVLVDYKLYIGNAFKLNTYNLKQTDYDLSGSDLLGFKFDATPEDYLKGIITSNISNPKEGDYALAKYFQFTGSAYTVIPKVSLKENFDYGATAGDLTTLSSGNWTAHSGAGSGPIGYDATSLSMTNYPSTNVGGSLTFGTGSEDVNSEFTPLSSGIVFASALVNLSAVSSGNYFFHLMEAANTLPYAQFRARVGAKTDGSGKILFGIGASSSTLTYGTTAFDLNTTYLLVASYDIATGTSNLYVLTNAATTEPTTPEATNNGDAGNIIAAVAIRQSGGVPTGSIDGVRVANSWSAIMSDATLPAEVIGAKNSYESFYTFDNGVWKSPSDRFYTLSEDDFASMGLTSFGSSTPQDNYLPTFLGIKFPYAQEGDELDVMYNYVSSSSGAQTRSNLYTFTDGAWVPYQSTINTTLQFGHDGATWVPDNTIKYTLVRDDYTFIGTALETVSGYETPSASAKNYGNFDRRVGNAAFWSDAMLVKAMDVLLAKVDPSAAVGQKYLMTYAIYNGSAGVESISVIKNAEGKWVANI